MAVSIFEVVPEQVMELGIECVPGVGGVFGVSQAREGGLCGQRNHLTEKAFQRWPCLYRNKTVECYPTAVLGGLWCVLPAALSVWRGVLVCQDSQNSIAQTGGLKQWIYFITVLEVGSPGSRCQ